MPSSSVFSNPLGWYAYDGSMTHRSRNWAVTPNYLNVPKPELPVNAYADSQVKGNQNLWWWTRTFDSGAVSYVSGPGMSYFFQDLRIMHDNMLVWWNYDSKLSSLINETMLKALVKTADQKANLAVSLKEADKTSTLILNRAKTLYQAYRSFRRGDLRAVADHLGISRKRVHNTWLEYKYGWTPLLKEVQGAAEFLAQQAVGRRNAFTVSASETLEIDGDRTTSNGVLDGMTWNGSESISGSVKVRVKIWLELTSPHFSATQQLGLTNPLLYAWEVTPFSFVFDWFISVGDYLTGLTALNGVTVRKAMVSSERDVTYAYNYPAMSRDNGDYVSYVHNRTGTYQNRTYSRAPTAVDPLSLYPPVNVGLPSWQKLVTGCALLRTRARDLERSGLRL